MLPPMMAMSQVWVVVMGLSSLGGGNNSRVDVLVRPVWRRRGGASIVRVKGARG